MKKLLKRLMPVMMALLCFLDVSAQEKKQVTGTVHGPDGNPVPSATIKEKGTTNQVTSNLKGVFKISIAPGGKLVISSVGYNTQEVTPDAAGVAEVNLSEATTEMTGVVVTALGIKRQKKSLGYAVQEIKGQSLVDAREPNLANALTGKVAGLQVIRSSNGPAGSSKMVLRGYNSLTGSNQPLIVVDGVPMDNFTGASNNDYWNPSLDMGNGIADINPDDIENISVLKGPSAAALYGSRAGNGVVMITTKSGKKQKGLGITVSSAIGFESIFTSPKMQSDFGQGSDNVYNQTSTLSWGPKIAGQQVTNWNGQQVPLTAYDNVGNYFSKNGTTQNYNLSFQQQIQRTSIYTSFNRLDDKSMLPGAKLSRTNLMARAISAFGNSDRWTTDTKIQYTNAVANNRPIGGPNPTNGYYMMNLLPRSIDIRDFKDATNEFGNMIWWSGAGNQVNPYWNSKYNQNQDVRNRFILNGSLKYKFTNWLTAEVKGGADMYTTENDAKTYAGSPLTSTGRYSLGKQTFRETNFGTLITATKDNLFGKLGGSATLGGNLMHQKYSSLNASAGELVVPNLFAINNGVNSPEVGEGFNQKKINSVYGSVQFNWDGYLYLDITARNDWSSALSKSNRSFFYPSVSMSYVFTEMLENFGIKRPDWLSYGKLRASYATVGNDLPAYQLYNVYGIGKDPNGNTTASRDRVLLDPDVRSELIKSTELGAELRFLNNRLGIDFAWYKSNATNQLLNLPMDPMSGYNSKKINAGNIQNSGIEIVADARILTNPNSLQWNVSANYSTNKNLIKDLYPGVTTYGLGGYDDISILAVVGERYGDIYGTQYKRVTDKTNPEFGRILLNGSGLPERDPVTIRLGNQQPKAIVGLTNTFSYKGLALSFLVDARIGGKMFSGTLADMQQMGTSSVTVVNGGRDSIVVDGVIWNAATSSYVQNTKKVSPQQYWNAVAGANNLGITEANLYDATNVRLRQIQLQYELPGRLLSKTPIQKARVGVSCNNVWLIKSHLNGLDPESVFATGTNAVGFENGSAPSIRTFLVNLSLTF